MELTRRAALGTAALAALTGTARAAEDTLAAIKARGKLVVGVKNDYPP